jgi:NAD(P)-dependent dehydrogenase (short-subunit alcohol dehydrogenase family)
MNILVTGSTRGIGKVIAEELCTVGDVFVTGRNEELLKSSKSAGYCICDLSKNIQPLIDFINSNKIDVLINNAGEYIYSAIDRLSNEQINQLTNTNFIAPIKLISAATPYMKNKKFGRIINIGSISGVMGEAYASLYSATKSGLIGLSKALALELAEYNITVNTINPGWVETDLGNTSIEESDFSKEELIDIIPQKRFVAPIEIAKLIRYLISEDAKGITGQSINLCAGLSVGF